jgi:hypothetical protein
VRRFGTILAFGTLACACLFVQTKTTVPGMSRFTNAGFGFSFCYPATWKVMDEPVATSTRNGWFPECDLSRPERGSVKISAIPGIKALRANFR